MSYYPPHFIRRSSGSNELHVLVTTAQSTVTRRSSPDELEQEAQFINGLEDLITPIELLSRAAHVAQQRRGPRSVSPSPQRRPLPTCPLMERDARLPSMRACLSAERR